MFHSVSLKFKFTELTKKFFVVHCRSFIVMLKKKLSIFIGLDILFSFLFPSALNLPLSWKANFYIHVNLQVVMLQLCIFCVPSFRYCLTREHSGFWTNCNRFAWQIKIVCFHFFKLHGRLHHTVLLRLADSIAITYAGLISERQYSVWKARLRRKTCEGIDASCDERHTPWMSASSEENLRAQYPYRQWLMPLKTSKESTARSET